MDEDFICPMVWKWSDIFDKLVEQWNTHPDHDEIPEPVIGSEMHDEMILQFSSRGNNHKLNALVLFNKTLSAN